MGKDNKEESPIVIKQGNSKAYFSEQDTTAEQTAEVHGRHHGRRVNMKKMFRLSLTAVIFLIIANVLVVFDAVLLTRYASLSQKIFIEINAVLMAVLIVIDSIAIFGIRRRRRAALIICLVIAIAFSAAGGYGAYAVMRISGSVNDLTASTYTNTVTASLVVYSGNDTSDLTGASDLDGKKVGIAVGTDTASAAETYFEDKNIDADFVEYNGYTEVYKALISGEIDCAVLPQTYESIVSSDETLYAYYPDTSILTSFSSSVEAESVAAETKDLTSEPFTVLLSGENEGLADTIIIVSVNPVSMTVTMTSIARDSYVPITCYNNSSSKINAAHAVSEACLVDTVEQLTGIDIDYTVEFNFASVIEIVDAVGGVEVQNDTSFDGQSWNLETDELEVIPIPYDENGGYVHMNGQEALGFVRERHAFIDGDFARQRHQQAVIEAVIQKVMATNNPNTYLNILSAVGDNMKTNMSSNAVLSFISYAMGKLNRYWNPSNPAGIFNFVTGRITGYSSSVYDPTYGFNLYTYELYDGAIEDAKKAVEENTDLYRDPDPFVSVSWNASYAYTAPVMIQETYDEAVDYSDQTYDNSTYQDNSYYYPEYTVPEETQDNTETQTQEQTATDQSTAETAPSEEQTQEQTQEQTDQSELVQDQTQQTEELPADQTDTESSGQ